MATRDEPLDPQEVLAAAEAAHLAARRTVPIAPARSPTEGDSLTAGQPTVRLSERPPTRARRGRAPLPLAAATAAGWAALVPLVPAAVVMLLLQAAEAGPVAVGGALRTAAAGWLLAHGTPVVTGAGPIGLAPLALTALAAWRLVRAGVHVTRALGARGTGSVRSALVAAGSVAVAYGILGALVAFMVDGPGWGVAPARAGLTLAGFGFGAGAYGSLRAAGVPLPRRIPPLVRDGGRAGLVAAAVLVAAGAAMAGIAIAAGGGAAAETLAAYRTGVAGEAALTLLCLAYAPNLAVWAVAYLVGPGFAVGTATVVRGSEVAIGSLPPLPVFAGLPVGPMPTVAAMLLTLPLFAGAVAGWLLAGARPGWTRLLGGAAVSGVVGGVLLGLAAAASGGSLGGGQLATMGPSPVLVGLFAAGIMTAGALIGAAVTAGLARAKAP